MIVRLAPNGAGHGLAEDAAARRFQRQIGAGLFAQQEISTGFFAEAGLIPRLVPFDTGSFQQTPLITSGLMDVFVKTCQRWRLTDEQQMVLLGYPGAELYFHQLKFGQTPLISQDAKDRIGYLLHISIGLGSIYNEVEEAELAWLSRARERFDNASALQFMLRGKMMHLIAVSDAVLEERNP